MSASEAQPPTRERTSSQQAQSDQADRRATLALFGGIVVLAAIGVTIAAIANSAMHHHGSGYAVGASASVSRSGGGAQHVSLYVAASWKKGPDGQLHDGFSKTDFAVRVGQPLRLTIDNRDDAVHSITAAGAGVNIVVMPGVHTYTLVVSRAGRFKWICAYPCDPFAMENVGYMQGYITAT